jgi:hypothetical protein
VPQPRELACDKRFFRGFPDPGWSDAVNAALADAVHTRPELSGTANAELAEIPGDELWLRQHRNALGSRPVRVITAAQHFNDDAATPADVRARHERFNREMIDAQARLLELSSNAKQIFARHSRNAYVQFDEPELVITAMREAAGTRSRCGTRTSRRWSKSPPTRSGFSNTAARWAARRSGFSPLETMESVTSTGPPEPTIEHLKYEYDRALAQSRWLTLSSDSRQIFVSGSSEYIQFDRPEAVVEAVREVVDLAKR